MQQLKQPLPLISCHLVAFALSLWCLKSKRNKLTYSVLTKIGLQKSSWKSNLVALPFCVDSLPMFKLLHGDRLFEFRTQRQLSVHFYTVVHSMLYWCNLLCKYVYRDVHGSVGFVWVHCGVLLLLGIEPTVHLFIQKRIPFCWWINNWLCGFPVEP